jgi:hypothetical protein
MDFRALTDLLLPDGRIIQAGQTFTAPPNYPPPTSAVDPLTPGAVEAYFAVGPRGMADAQPYQVQFTNGQRWSDLRVAPPVTFWRPVDPTKPWLGFTLSGLGGNYGTAI